MSNIDVTGPKLKIARANRHIRDFQSLIQTFIADNPHRIEFAEDAESVSVVARFDRPLPNECATIIGDAIHNLRAALDHLAAEAIRSCGGLVSRTAGFPIYKNKVDFEREIGNKLAGAAQPFIDYVKAQRPYRSADDGSQGAIEFWMLSQLDNLDKHATLLPTISVVTLRNLKIRAPDNGTAVTIGKVSVSGNARIAKIHGSGMIYSADSNSDFSVRFVNTNIVDGEDVVNLLASFEKCVQQTVTGAATLAL